MTSLVLVCILLRAAISDWLILLVPLCNFIIYRQLFGYGIWGTLWRTLLCLGIIFYFFSIIMMVAKYAQGEYMSEHSTGAVIAMVIALVVVGVAIMLLGWWIGKRTASKKVA